ncbi:MAG: GNAT family N-acetyltransferase [Cycloclasticus sp.]|nr:MAG: GNAT family N-acetyltransferase [Cycloclasticus sp.]
MKGWHEVGVDDYSAAYDKFGGSVLSNPDVLNAIAVVVDLPIQYFAYKNIDGVQAVIPVWKNWVAGSKLGLNKMSRKGMVDFGNAELILPISEKANLALPVRANNLSLKNRSNITNLQDSQMDICLAKKPHEFSKKVRYNRKRELRLLEEAGATVQSVDSMSNEEISIMYSKLFELRWGFKATGFEYLTDLLDYVRPLLFGAVIKLDGKAIAFQLIYKSECYSHISMEYINGGVDPAYKELGAGSVLTYLNTQRAWKLSEQLGKSLRYSFGKADNEYKDRWCNRSAVYSV